MCTLHGSFAVNGATLLFSAVALSSLAAPPPARAFQEPATQAAEQGRETFETLCTACHTIGQGTRLGPDLEGVTQRRDEEWLIDFVQRSQDLIASGDPVATELFQEFDQLVMPDQPLTDGQVRDVLAYIRQTSSSAPARSSSSDPGAPAPSEEFTEDQIRRGRALFQGTARFSGGGPACNSCHDVAHASVVGGGSLAVDLTDAYTRLGGAAGIRAMAANPPFPVMARAYEGRPLTDGEIQAVTGFLRRADEDPAASRPGRYASILLAAGFGGTGLFLAASALFWRGRRKESVNEAIYRRQTKST